MITQHARAVRLQGVQGLVAGMVEHDQRVAMLQHVGRDAVTHQADPDHADALLHEGTPSCRRIDTRPRTGAPATPRILGVGAPQRRAACASASRGNSLPLDFGRRYPDR